jgi:uncharacterized membrane protein
MLHILIVVGQSLWGNTLMSKMVTISICTCFFSSLVVYKMRNFDVGAFHKILSLKDVEKKIC